MREVKSFITFHLWNFFSSFSKPLNRKWPFPKTAWNGNTGKYIKYIINGRCQQKIQNIVMRCCKNKINSLSTKKQKRHDKDKLTRGWQMLQHYVMPVPKLNCNSGQTLSQIDFKYLEFTTITIYKYMNPIGKVRNIKKMDPILKVNLSLVTNRHLHPRPRRLEFTNRTKCISNLQNT